MPEDDGPIREVPPGVAESWTKPLSEFATLPEVELEPGLRERHRIYSLLTMAVVASQFNGNKHGDRGDYGAWRVGQVEVGAGGERIYRGGTYLGHNIGAIAVDARGTIVDFDFNHNEVFNSSVEHAESRLVRRLFALAQVFDPWRQAGVGVAPGVAAGAAGVAADAPRTFLFTADPVATRAAATGGAPAHRGYGTLLADVSIYTSLESCAQCSGIMALANVREVAYLQYDQGQYLVGNLMWRATRGGGSPAGAPRPIPGSDFGFEWYEQLNAANLEFAGRVKKEPFLRGGGFRDASASVTSFLCTDRALEIYSDAANALESMPEPAHPDYRRPDHLGHPVEGALSNAEVVAAAKRFIAYVRSQGRRGTQHRV